MLQSTAGSHQQLTNMYSQSIVTTWRTNYLHTLEHPKKFRHNLRLRLHRSGPHSLVENPPHAWKHLAMSSQQSAIAIAPSGLLILAKIKPHVLKHPKMFGPQSLAAFTPKWSTRPGSTSTSCFKVPRELINNLQICLHKVLSQPGEQSTS